MKLLHISDTHGFHSLLNIPEDIDLIIHSGDESNWKDPYKNEQECLDFLEWYGSLKIPKKIFVAGNHSTAIYKGLVTRKQIEDKGIIYLENESVGIDLNAGWRSLANNGKQGSTIVPPNILKIWGSPYTPTFGEWSFMKRRDKLHDLWATIPENTDIVVVHGPPMGIMDLSYNRENKLEFCGCSALRKRILKIEPTLFLSGHIHNCEDIINAGTLKLSAYKTIFSNGSVVTDGKFGKLSSHGNTFEI